MKTRWPSWCLAGVGFGLLALNGCQTWTAGMTLPTPRYLQHPPQYFPPSPAFPLSRELASQEAIAGAAPGVPAVPLPPAVPGGGGPAPAPVPPVPVP
jgi:hypothetical protein